MLIGDPASDDWPLAIAEYRAVAAEQASDVLQDEVYGPCESGSAEAEELHEAEERQVVVQCLGNAYSTSKKETSIAQKACTSQFGSTKRRHDDEATRPYRTRSSKVKRPVSRYCGVVTLCTGALNGMQLNAQGRLTAESNGRIRTAAVAATSKARARARAGGIQPSSRKPKPRRASCQARQAQHTAPPNLSARAFPPFATAPPGQLLCIKLLNFVKFQVLFKC